MRILITGAAGFVGTSLAHALRSAIAGVDLIGIDNLSRAGSETNRSTLRALGVRLVHGDLRLASDVEALPAADWVIDAAANPSVLAGIDGRSSPRQLVEHNLGGTLHLLDYCRQHRAGLILLSTSRVYSIPALAALPVSAQDGAFRWNANTPAASVVGASEQGIREDFSTEAPVSLYGATKLASETLALEYGDAFGFPVWINRCGVLAGAGQFGRADQGIFAYWINRHLRRRPLRYIGFGGHGFQVRDCLHPADLAHLVHSQLTSTTVAPSPGSRIFHVGGGIGSARSLLQLTAWCDDRFGPHAVAEDPAPRPYDLPWIVLDARRAESRWQWRPTRGPEQIFQEIAEHAERNPEWLEHSEG
jgi:CDP-paratose 2-epimerase